MNRQRNIGRSSLKLGLECLESRYAMDASFTTAKFDFGTATSPLESGYTRVTERTAFNPTTGFGWTSGSISGVDRATGTALTRDFNYTPDGTFVVNVPNGRYQVKATLGDLGSYAHDQVGIYLESVLVDTVSTAARQVVNRGYEVNVTDQQLTMRLRDLGGSDRNGVIAALEISLQTPTLSVNDARIAEGDAGSRDLTFDVLLSSVSTTDVQVGFATSSGTATAGSDFVSKRGTLTIPAGLRSVSITVAILGDQMIEADESFNLVLSNPVGATLANRSATGTITNNDLLPSLTLGVPSGPFLESRSTPVSATVRRTGSTAAALQVALVSSDRSEATVPAIVTIPQGQTSVTFPIRLVDDALLDGTKNVLITATAAGFETSRATIQVADDDIPPFFRVFDFSTTRSALSGNFAKVNEGSTYSTALGYGFNAGAVRSADRGGSTLISDFIYTADATFAIDVPNSRYVIDVIMGDLGNFAHDQMGVFIEGVQAGSVSTGSGQIVSRTYSGKFPMDNSICGFVTWADPTQTRLSRRFACTPRELNPMQGSIGQRKLEFRMPFFRSGQLTQKASTAIPLVPVTSGRQIRFA